jgi:hypothetical protein
MTDVTDATTNDVVEVRTIAGITDPEWLNWFSNEIPHCYDSWNDWLKHLRFPPANALIGWLGLDIRDLIKTADVLRKWTVPQTKTFKEQYNIFRKHHEELDCRGKYCRLRYMVWRAAALKVIWDRGQFQDCVARRETRDTLLATMHFFWPTIDVDGNFDGGNFWVVSDPTKPDALTEYAAMVLLLMRQASKEKM